MANSIETFLNHITQQSDKNSDKEYLGIGGFTMFVAISETASFTATAPDVVSEDLKTAQDSVIIHPKTFSITGESAEIFIRTEQDEGFGSTAAKILNTVTPYLPQRTLSQIQKVENVANEIDNALSMATQVLSGVNDLFDLFQDKADVSTNIQNFFNFIERTYDTRSIIRIELKQKVYENILITSFQHTETNDGDTGDFIINFKQLRINSIDLFRDNQNLSDSESAKVAPNTSLDGQVDAPVDKGVNGAVPVNQAKSDQVLSRVL